MTYSIVFSSRTGNTQLLAETIRKSFPQPLYFGAPAEEALAADLIFIGFWTDKGQPDSDCAEFLKTVHNKKVFLFGTAGFGLEDAYFQKILSGARKKLGKDNEILGSFMCQGKMPMSVRERYVKMLENPVHMPNLKNMIHNFDLALSHPDSRDLENLAASLPALE